MQPARIAWPRKAHPQALTEAGRSRTPWLTSWARATFEQGVLSLLPLLEGPCCATPLPGEHLFQASAMPTNRMRPANFHAFGKAKASAQDALRCLEKQGWETLPISPLSECRTFRLHGPMMTGNPSEAASSQDIALVWSAAVPCDFASCYEITHRTVPRFV